jgi:hypothetical protein
MTFLVPNQTKHFVPIDTLKLSMRAKTMQLEKTWEGEEKLQGLLQTDHNSVRRDRKKGDGR